MLPWTDHGQEDTQAMQPSSAAGGGQADLQGACIHRVWGEDLQDGKCSTHAAHVEETLGHH